jgi:hypothetical protein
MTSNANASNGGVRIGAHMDTEASVWQSNVTRFESSFAHYGEVHVSMSVPAKSQRLQCVRQGKVRTCPGC